MHEIVEKQQLSPNVTRLVVARRGSPRSGSRASSSSCRLGEGAERIPLTIADADPVEGTISLIIQAVGKSTMDLVDQPVGGAIQDIAGPLGRPTDLIETGRAVCVGGGVGTAVVYPIAQELHRRGVDVTRSSVVAPESGSSSRTSCSRPARSSPAPTTAVVRPTRLRHRGPQGPVRRRRRSTPSTPSGPVPMMRAVSELTRPYGIPTTVSLNAIMVDGTGMCGGCRVAVDGETKYACVDGPEFDGHTVDFELLADRLTTYRDVRAGRPREASRLPHPSPRRERPRPPPPRRRSLHDRARPRGASPARARPADPEGAHGDRAPGDARARRHGPLPRLHRGQPGLHRPARDRRGRALPPVQEPEVHRGLPGPGQHPPVHRPARRGRRPRGGRIAPRRQRPALRHRPGLPAGDPVRGASACAAKKGKPVAIGYLERYVADWAQAHPERDDPPGPPERRQAGRDRRLRAGRADRGRRARASSATT